MSKYDHKSQHLTERQAEILRYVHAYISERGFAPSIREIGDAVHLSSSSTVHSHLRSLEAKGFISHDPSRPRSLEVTNWEDAQDCMPKICTASSSTVSQLDLSNFISRAANSLIYRISSDRYMDQAIMPGDMVIVDPDQAAEDGDMVLTQDSKLEPEICTYSSSRQAQSVVGRISGIIRNLPRRM